MMSAGASPSPAPNTPSGTSGSQRSARSSRTAAHGVGILISPTTTMATAPRLWVSWWSRATPKLLLPRSSGSPCARRRGTSAQIGNGCRVESLCIRGTCHNRIIPRSGAGVGGGQVAGGPLPAPEPDNLRSILDARRCRYGKRCSKLVSDWRAVSVRLCFLQTP